MIVRHLLLNLMIAILLGATSFAQTVGQARVAVLPFEVYSNIRSAGLQKMIAEDLSMRIADEGQINVVDYSTISTFLDKSTPSFNKASLLDISEKLEADFLVLGSITKIGENLSLDTYLFNPRGTPSFSKSFAEGKNLNALLKEMGTKINAQVLETVLSYQKTPAAEEEGAPKATGGTEPVESAAEKTPEVLEEPAGEEESAEGPVVAYAETGSGEEVLQPSDSLIEEVPEEIVPEEAGQEAPSAETVNIIEEQEGETPKEPPVADTDSREEVPEKRAAEETGQEAFPEAVDEDTQEQPVIIEEEEEIPEGPGVADIDTGSREEALQPSDSLIEETPREMAAEEEVRQVSPEAADEEDREAIDVLSEIPEEEDAPATVVLLKEPEGEEIDSTEKESEDKSFSSPFSTLKPVKITSKTMEADNKRNMVTFKGDVVVKQEDIVIFSDTMKVSYEPKGGINKVEASGNVKMSQENRIATGKKLVFYNPEQKIVMTGSPKIWQGDNLISCEKVTVLLEDNKIVFEGKVDSIIYPRSLKEEQEKEDQEENQVEEITIPLLEDEPAGETVVQ
ncbi:MAG: lipopolysaccharide transport periplasmic protein LptA [Thermodesulfobacteriota bacterium]|nr:lipopolysaccharide transport periplasmic protein LptA [Thermodesulfobacteriota bacterium]